MPRRPAAGTRPVTFDPAEALAHLRAADPVLGGLIDAHGGPSFEPDAGRDHGDHYGALVRAIVGQQLSTSVARIIFGRLTERFGGRPPTPEEILAEDPEELRAAAGLSRAKVGFLRSLAEHVVSGELDLDHVATLPDEELVRELTAVKGIGEWSAHMFLMFQLERPDVLATGDLGVRRAAQRAYGLADLPTAGELTALAEPWRPYRSVACRVLWWSLDNEPG
jgi:DNA-3-methyladenine glycosylase II